MKAQQTKPARRLVLVDTENLAGNPRPTESEVDWIFKKLDDHLAVRPQDLVYVGGHPQSAFTCNRLASQLGGAMCLRRGRDGADQVLLERASMLPDSAFNSDLYPVLGCIIASGDHAFAPLARSMTGRGVHVTVVSRAGSLSSLLAVAANQIIILDRFATETEALAA